MPLVLEALVTTLDRDGTPHLAPMGPHVVPDLSRFTLRPFATSHTARNLLDTRQGVLHVTDDALLIARAAIGRAEPLPPTLHARHVVGVILAGACRALEFRVGEVDTSHERLRLECQTVFTHELRPFFGFCRARHAVVEAAILATRVHLLPLANILERFAQLMPLVEKTGGPDEFEAFALLTEYVTDMGAT